VKKIITTALIAATAVATLSACNVEEAGKTTGLNNKFVAKHTGGKAKAPAGPSYTVAQENALESAQSYLDMTGFSRAGLIEQLSSKAGEGFKMKDAVFAVDHIKVNWKREAVESAKSYLDMTSFSRASLIDQLASDAGEGFTLAQANYAADKVGF
jgi:hypothetical protein